MWHVRRATQEDLLDLAPRLRQADKDEMFAATGKEPLECLQTSLSLPAVGAWVGTKDDRPEILFGLVKGDHPDVGIPWMVCTDALQNSPMAFLKKCRAWVRGFSKQFPLLINYVHHKNELHIKWLKWCGFEFIQLHPEYGVSREPFWEFRMVQLRSKE